MNNFVLFALLACSPIAVWVGHAVLSRMCRSLGYHSIPTQFVALAVIGLGNGPVLWTAWRLGLGEMTRSPGEFLCRCLYVLLTYNLLGFIYLSILNASETSLHVHILIMLLLEGRLSVSELSIRYSAEEVIAARVDRMLALGQLTKEGECYVVASRALIVTGEVLSAWRLVLGLPLKPS